MDKCVEPGVFVLRRQNCGVERIGERGKGNDEGEENRLGGLVFSACFTVADYLLVSEVAQWPLTQRLADFSCSVDSPVESHMTGCSAEPLILHSKHSDLGGTGQKEQQKHVMTHTHTYNLQQDFVGQRNQNMFNNKISIKYV